MRLVPRWLAVWWKQSWCRHHHCRLLCREIEIGWYDEKLGLHMHKPGYEWQCVRCGREITADSADNHDAGWHSGVVGVPLDQELPHVHHWHFDEWVRRKHCCRCGLVADWHWDRPPTMRGRLTGVGP